MSFESERAERCAIDAMSRAAAINVSPDELVFRDRRVKVTIQPYATKLEMCPIAFAPTDVLVLG